VAYLHFIERWYAINRLTLFVPTCRWVRPLHCLKREWAWRWESRHIRWLDIWAHWHGASLWQHQVHQYQTSNGSSDSVDLSLTLQWWLLQWLGLSALVHRSAAVQLYNSAQVCTKTLNCHFMFCNYSCIVYNVYQLEYFLSRPSLNLSLFPFLMRCILHFNASSTVVDDHWLVVAACFV